MSISFGPLRSEYGFLSLLTPSPFENEGVRWRTVQQAYNALSPGKTYDEKKNLFRQLSILSYMANPSLVDQLLSTRGYRLEYSLPSDIKDSIGPILMDIRDTIFHRADKIEDRDILYTNLYTVLKGQGYTHYIGDGETEQDIMDAPRKQVKGLKIVGKIKKEERLNVRGEFTVVSSSKVEVEKEISAIVDIYLDNNIKEDRLKEVITTFLSERKGAKEVRVKGRAYFVVSQVSKTDLNKFLRMPMYSKIVFYSPSELYVIPSKHMLTSMTRRVTRSDPMYKILKENRENLPELSVEDKLSKELGYKVGDILAVSDFSPHYRVVV